MKIPLKLSGIFLLLKLNLFNATTLVRKNLKEGLHYIKDALKDFLEVLEQEKVRVEVKLLNLFCFSWKG